MRLEDEFQYYLDHQSEFVDQFNGKVIVLKNHEVIGAYSSQDEAIDETAKHHELGTFLVQRCTPGNEAYTVTIHSHYRAPRR